MAANPSTIQANAEQFKQLQRAFGEIILNSTQSLIRTFTGKTLNYLQQAWIGADEPTQEAFKNWVKTQPNGEEKTRRLELYFSIIHENGSEYVVVDEEDDDDLEDSFLLHLAESAGLKPGETLFGRKEVAAAPQGASSSDNGSTVDATALTRDLTAQLEAQSSQLAELTQKIAILDKANATAKAQEGSAIDKLDQSEEERLRLAQEKADLERQLKEALEEKSREVQAAKAREEQLRREAAESQAREQQLARESQEKEAARLQEEKARRAAEVEVDASRKREEEARRAAQVAHEAQERAEAAAAEATRLAAAGGGVKILTEAERKALAAAARKR